MQIKADLRDVLYSHKWTPDAYLMAKAYVVGREEEEEGERWDPCSSPWSINMILQYSSVSLTSSVVANLGFLSSELC